MALQSPVEFENIHKEFQFVGRYSYAGGANASKLFHTGNRFTDRLLDHTNAIEIWKSEGSVVVFSWTESQYEQVLNYILNEEMDKDEDWSVLALMENENSLKIKWRSKTGRAASQTARYEFTDEKLKIFITNGDLYSLTVNFKKIDGPRSDMSLTEILIAILETDSDDEEKYNR